PLFSWAHQHKQKVRTLIWVRTLFLEPTTHLVAACLNLGYSHRRPLAAPPDERTLPFARVGGAVVFFLGNPRALTGKTPQVIKLRPPHLATAHHLDRCQGRGIEGEHPPPPFAEGDLPEGDGGRDAPRDRGEAH